MFSATLLFGASMFMVALIWIGKGMFDARRKPRRRASDTLVPRERTKEEQAWKKQHEQQHGVGAKRIRKPPLSG